MRDTGYDFNNLVRFLEIVGRLKKVPRAGWVDVGIQNPESVADHIFRTTILCMVYAKMDKLNQLKIMKMALIHDLPEAITGDVTPSRKTVESNKKENAALIQILNLLPEKQRKEYQKSWNEYKKGETREAKAVKQLEKLELALQSREYEKSKATDQSLKRFTESVKKTIELPKLTRLLTCILKK